MITTGRILEINLDSKNHKANKYKVEVTIFKRPGDNYSENYTFLANCAITPGFNNCYNVGDVVYVAFLNNHLDTAIIIGKIYQGLDKEPCGYASLKSLSVHEKVSLPKDISIGDITYQELENLLVWQKVSSNMSMSCFYPEDNYYIIDGGRVGSIPVDD